MVKIEIAEDLFEEVEKRFKQDSTKIFDLIETLEDNPKKGKLVGNVGGIVIKELRYKGFRFFFLADGFKLKFLNEEELTDLLLKFVRMSDKKHQQKVIDEIKHILRTIGAGGF
jgi:mRNA-degrading endonuclease RelE of RelBE toxin-antitoxin system